jgi:hypothetical protein
MYAATATICVAIDKLNQFTGNMDSTLLFEARSELEIARNLLENRWQKPQPPRTGVRVWVVIQYVVGVISFK